jgi:hypothetical protein
MKDVSVQGGPFLGDMQSRLRTQIAKSDTSRDFEGQMIKLRRDGRVIAKINVIDEIVGNTAKSVLEVI